MSETPEQPQEPTVEEIEQHQKHYSEEKFWDKLGNNAKSAGSKVIEQALTLYYTAISPNTPMWAKTLIFGALGYFILPIDAIPDMIPVAGFSDDLVTLAAAVTAVGKHMTPEQSEKAKITLAKWFPNKKLPSSKPG